MNKKKNTREFREDKVILLVDKTKSIDAFKISKFTSSLKNPLLYSRIQITTHFF